MLISVDQLRAGKSGVVRSVEGGRGILQRLEGMGVRPGKTVVKVSGLFMGGPVTVTVDGRQVAMGRGIAGRVMVETERDG
ncbi:MAG TPA: FeoA family protein [Planctomycetota bacterium]|nr:FeoA family protein [Planctomycetota bacterium]